MFGAWGARDEVVFVCPRCGDEDHSVWKLPNPLLLHWVLNPGLLVNELILGQRTPARLYFCKGCRRAMYRRQYVYCPGCGELHDGMIRAKDHAFGHWLGLICPDCGSRIPSLLNVTSWLVLTVLSPVRWLLWWWFGERYQASEQRRAARARAKLEAREREEAGRTRQEA